MRRQIVKWSYLAVLVAGIVYLLNTFAAGYVLIRAEGLVVGQPATVAAEYTATVREVFVKEGQEINKGDVVAQISSQAIVESRARLTSDYALRVSKLAELKARGEVVEATLTSAEARERSAVEGKAQLDTIDRKGFLPILTRTTAAEQAYRGKQDAESLRSEQRALTGQRQEVTAATEEADAALHDLTRLYDSGKMRAPEKGMVSMVLAHPGSVVRAGDPMIELVGDHRFVLAWFPIWRHYSLHVGDAVNIDAGNSATYKGTVVKIAPIAGTLPREYQKSFAPTDRQQLVWIEFDDHDQAAQALPYFTKVNITGRYNGRQILSFVERWKNRAADALSPKESKRLLISGFDAVHGSNPDIGQTSPNDRV
jgi:multidrug resistance efflux pump